MADLEFRISGTNEIVTVLVRLQSWWLVTDDSKGPRWARALDIKPRRAIPIVTPDLAAATRDLEARAAATQAARFLRVIVGDVA